jgi:ABC-type Fe3+/spermidine/putrescine transport system ATPase subunit
VTHDQEEAAVLSDKIALILRGRLQHFGPPEEYFERPASVEIARFFGGVNFIPGAYDGSVIATSIGKFSAPRSSIASGAGVLTIRPEAVEIGGEGANSVPGRVVSHVYAGRYARFLIDVGGIRIEAVSDPKRVSQIADGDSVSLRFDPNEIWVLAQPTEGDGVSLGASEGGNGSVASVSGDE